MSGSRIVVEWARGPKVSGICCNKVSFEIVIVYSMTIVVTVNVTELKDLIEVSYLLFLC